MRRNIMDAYLSVLLDPTCSSAWHGLFEKCVVCGLSSNDSKFIIEELRARVFNDPISEILRLTWLRDVTGEPRLGGEAAKLALTLSPRNPDRLLSMAAYAWAWSITKSVSRLGFIDWLTSQQIPEIVSALNAVARQCLGTDKSCISNKKVTRVALIAQYLADKNHTPSRLVANIVRILYQNGIEVKLFSTQDLVVNDPGRFSGSTLTTLLPPVNGQFWQQELPNNVELTYFDTSFTANSRWSDSIEQVMEYSPDVILSCGLFSPLVSALYNRFPVASINVHSNLPVMTDSDVQLVGEEDSGKIACPWDNKFALGEFLHFPYRLPSPAIQQQQEMPVSLPHNALCWISVGFRLNSEMPAPWLERMGALLHEHPAVHWLLVGIDLLPTGCETLAPGRVHALGRSSAVPALLRRADIYVNPPRLGGGFSVLEAMAVGLPVVSYRQSDGGEKVGDDAVDTDEAYVAKLARLTSEKDFRERLGSRLRARFDARYNLDLAGPVLLNALQHAAARAASRLNGLNVKQVEDNIV